uniref:Integrase, catalytic region, zinc finger, CCHC-type, peptidase aspartic, catalytic n=1 Tax=Tanacetum cinerariifolium TaxID=118510 RepID=A0A699H8P4_TANCI|nr:hypothetical protein [Tanacetum cinerariifolium]
MANLSDSEDIQYAGFDHDHYLEAACAYHEEHMMHEYVQLDHVVNSHDEYMSDSNITMCDQYVRDNENTVVKNSLTAELAIYKEHVELYEQRAKFELTEREQKINEQLRIVISNRNFKEETLKRDLHSMKLQLASTIKHNKSMVEEVSFLKKDFKQKENKYLADFLNIKTLKEKVKDKLIKQDQSLQTVHMLCKPRPNYNELKRVAIGYKNPLCLTRAKQAQPALYNGHEIIKDNHIQAIVHNSEDTLEISEITRKKMNDKMNDLNIKSKALRERTKVSKPIKAFTVYPPNTPAALVPKVLPTKSQVKILIFTLIQLFSEFDQTCKKRITPSAITDEERGFEQTKACYLQEVIPFFKTLKDNFEGIQKALTKEVKVGSREVFCVATNSELNAARFTHMHVANTTAETRCLLKYQNLKDQIGNSPPTPDKDTQDFDSVFVIGKMQYSLQGKDNVIRQLKKELSQLQVTRRDTDPQNDLFRAENDKIKQHYKELYDSIKITRAKYIELVTKVTTENINLTIGVRTIGMHILHLKESVETIRDIVEEAKVVRPLDRSIVSACRYTKHSQELLEYAIGTCPKVSQPRAKQLAHIPLIRKQQVTIAQPSNELDSTTHPHVVTVTSQKTNVPVPPSTGVDCCPIACRSPPMSHVKPNRISPAKGDTKLQIDGRPRKNKSHLRPATRIDSRSRLKRIVINSYSDSVCQTCAKCLTLFNHDLCVATCLQSTMATPFIHHNRSIKRKVMQVWKPKQVRQVWKPTGKVLTTIGHQWRPTGRIFNLGNQCPLTKFTPPKVVSATQHTKRTSPCANQKEPNQNWGSNLSNSLSLSGFTCREVAHQSAIVSHKFVTQSMTTASSIANGSLIKEESNFESYDTNQTSQNREQSIEKTLMYNGIMCQGEAITSYVVENKMADVNAPSDQTPTMAPPVCVAFCLTEFCLKEVNSVKVGFKGHYLGSSPHTMTDVTAPTGQAPTMAPPVRSKDQCLPRIRWVQTGYLKFSAKGTKREVFGMPVPSSLITADLREVSYYQEYLANVVKHRWFLSGEPARKPNPTAQKVRIHILQYLIHLRMCKDVPTKMMKMFLLVENLRRQNPDNRERFCSLWHRMYDTVMQDLGIPIQGQFLHSVP